MLTLDDDRALAAWEEWWLREPSCEDPEDEFEWQIADMEGEEKWAQKHMTS